MAQAETDLTGTERRDCILLDAAFALGQAAGIISQSHPDWSPDQITDITRPILLALKELQN